jgi:hypothetical protein
MRDGSWTDTFRVASVPDPVCQGSGRQCRHEQSLRFPLTSGKRRVCRRLGAAAKLLEREANPLNFAEKDNRIAGKMIQQITLPVILLTMYLDWIRRTSSSVPVPLASLRVQLGRGASRAGLPGLFRIFLSMKTPSIFSSPF